MTVRIVIIGCGFGGLEAAHALKGEDVQVTLVDRTNHHLFQPLLYQVATAGLSAPAISAPVRHLFRKQANVTTLLGEAVAIRLLQELSTTFNEDDAYFQLTRFDGTTVRIEDGFVDTVPAMAGS